MAANVVGTGGSWDVAGSGESIRYACYAYVTGGLATPCPAARPPQPIGVSTVYASFFANPNPSDQALGGAFGITRGTAPLFTAQFPTIDFNPPPDAQVSGHGHGVHAPARSPPRVERRG